MLDSSLRSAPTFRFVAERLEPLVQDDCATSPIETPLAVIELYGVRSQLLAGNDRDGEVERA